MIKSAGFMSLFCIYRRIPCAPKKIKTYCSQMLCVALLLGFRPVLGDEIPTAVDPAVASTTCVEFNTNPQDIVGKKSSRVDSSAFEYLQGKTIRTISFSQLTIFDENNPDENNRLYRLFNSMHVKTKPSVVDSQLLFKSGDKIDIYRMEEAARILRTRKYFTNAYILPARVCGDEVDIAVVTQDAWSIEPQVSFSRKSGDNQTGFGIIDGNILGSGNAFSIGYSESQVRNTVSYEFSNPHFLNQPIAVRMLYQDTSDGRNNVIDISHPFYALDTPWASGVKYSDLSQVETIRSHGVVINEFRHQDLLTEYFYGKATDINVKYTQRFVFGFSHEEDRFYETPLTQQNIPTRDKLSYPWVEYQFIQNKFALFKNLNQIQRTEDVAMGQSVALRIGLAGTAFGNPDDVIRYKGDYANIIDISDQHILEWKVKVDGHQHLAINHLDPNLLTSSLAYNYLQDENNRWYTRIEYGAGQSLPQYQELTVGDITGLRGYPTDYLRGNKRYALTLERRYFSDIHIFNLMRLGGVVFVDVGKAWGLINEANAPLLSDVGIGLRLSSTKIRIGNVIHVDFSVPTSARNGISHYQLSIGAEQKF